MGCPHINLSCTAQIEFVSPLWLTCVSPCIGGPWLQRFDDEFMRWDFLFHNEELLMARWHTDYAWERTMFGTQFTQMMKLSQHEAITGASLQLSSPQTLFQHAAAASWKIHLMNLKCAESFSWGGLRRYPPVLTSIPDPALKDLLRACLLHMTNSEPMLTVRCLRCEPRGESWTVWRAGWRLYLLSLEIWAAQCM